MPTPFPNPPHYLRGKLHCIDHCSQVLADNPWSDPVHRDVWVYTPPGYKDSTEAYPVVLFLAGFSSTGESMFGRSLTEISMARRIDGWLSSENDDPCPPFIAIFPDCMSTLVGTQYVDSPAIGNYATYLMTEVIPFIAQRFRCNGKLGITGRSSGGFGALSLTRQFPNQVHAIACHAGDMAFETTYLSELTASIMPIQAAGGPMPFIEAFWRKKRLSGGDFAAMNYLCMAAAYGADLEGEDFPARLPVDWRTGAIDWSAYQAWNAHDPLHWIEELSAQEALRGLDFCFLDAGNHDEYLLHLGARRFVARLKDFGVPHEYEEFNGGHRGTSYRYDVSIPKMVRILSAVQ